MHNDSNLGKSILYEMRNGKWYPSANVMLIGGSRSKGLGGFNKYVTEAAAIISAGDEVVLTPEMRDEVDRYIAYKNISAQVN